MKILIVEDDPQKLRDVTDEVHQLRPSAEITKAYSYKGAVKAALTTRFDLLVVDMTLPTVDIRLGDRGYKMLPYGGADIVQELTEENALPPCILISSFDELGTGVARRSFTSIAETLKKQLGAKLLGAVRYGAVFWRQQLAEILRTKFPT